MSDITIPLNSGMYSYKVPLKEPSDEKEIINFDKKKDDQFWRTPVIKPVKYMNARDRIQYIERERQRWEEGVFVLIEGELIYLTGMHYDHMTYMTFKSEKPVYFDHQRFDFYFRDHTRREVKCRGRVIMKPRRYGMTMQEVTEATYSLNENFSNNVALQSDTKDKVKTTLLAPLIDSYMMRPKYMRSDYYKPNGKKLVSELNLNSNLAPDEDGQMKGDYLLGWAKPFPSLPRSLDGNEVAYSVMSEIWKWQESSPKETMESNIKVLMGFKRAGKISLESTMGDSDDYVNSVMEGMDIIARSNPDIRDDNGYTLSGLYEYFVPATYSFDIPPEIFEYNKFGKVNVDKHNTYIHNTVNKHDKKTKSYIFELRRLPLKKADIMMSANLNTYFRRPVISSRLQELQKLPASKKPYVRGNLVEDTYGRVKFEADPEGIWIWSLLPYFSLERKIDCRNRFRFNNGIYYPPVNPEGAIGYDPTNFPNSQTTSSSLSRASIFVHKKFDYFNKPDSRDYAADLPMGLCVFRPDDPHDANIECIKAAKFTGFPVAHEKSVNHVYEDFKVAGMLPFLLQHKGVYGISPSDTVTKKDGLSLLLQRYKSPKEEGERDQLEEYPFEEGLMDLDNFDFNNNTPFDVTMSELYKELGLKQIIWTNETDQTYNNMLDIIHEIIVPRRH